MHELTIQTAAGPIEISTAIANVRNQVQAIAQLMRDVLKEGEHYGTVPGCGDKKCLLKPGAEKLGMVFRLKPAFAIVQREVGAGHREYEIRTTLSDGTEGVGCCSTMEGKYRFRQGERKCPKCGKPTIINGKKEYGGGFLCYAKKGGCGAKFNDGDVSITSQSIERVEHDNPADYYNTVLKMAKKRSHVDAIITATSASDIFTQDIDENLETEQHTPAAPTISRPSASNIPANMKRGSDLPPKQTRQAAPPPEQDHAPEPGSFDDFSNGDQSTEGDAMMNTPPDEAQPVPGGPLEVEGLFVLIKKSETNPETKKTTPYKFSIGGVAMSMFYSNERNIGIIKAAGKAFSENSKIVFHADYTEETHPKYGAQRTCVNLYTV